ncbi:geranylgeranyl diphosphate reductase [Aurantimonas endophytica]|uniref:Geranylgeranyl reductase n=1 Tax=Aurantimonas endophytica TaxID=1522175 RepID=A0A7W6HB68_9HYPH|nr:geranylgeranyl diphosphate reductase [Aurantimonas endophytica]MBB4001943.1 geranylgeranyl reductase [Aurantimonas endophytica]MCO6402424.1 geranylgeranyl diphosphate reductase [Aurantimonas endophytica]
MDSADVVVVGGGPAGATAAEMLARAGRSVVLLDRDGRIKPCGGAIPPRLVGDFDIPSELIVARIGSARMVAPSQRRVPMPIEDGGYVGMVDREHFDEWLRVRAAAAGARRLTGTFEQIERDADGGAVVRYRAPGLAKDAASGAIAARLVIGADGARSAVGRQNIKGADRMKFVFAYHEIVRSPVAGEADFDSRRCDVYYQGVISPDFYGWVFPHGATASIGTGSAEKGYGLRPAVARLRAATGLDRVETIRREGAPIPLKPLRRWDNGRDVILAGDAAGVVAPASGEGIYYAMISARMVAEAGLAFLATGDARALSTARKVFMREHGRVFWILGIMQTFWYRSDRQRERFVAICRDKDVQRLTWEAYMNKKLVRARPAAHIKIFFKDLAHLLRLVSP